MNSNSNSDANNIANKSYQTELDDSLLSSISVSIFSFIAAINIRNTDKRESTSIGNIFVIISLLFLSISFAVVGLVKYTTEFFNDLTGKYRYEFNYFSAIFYTILVSILIIVELVFSREIFYHLL